MGRALSPEEEGRLLTDAAGDESPNRNPGLYPFLCIALSTGMRSGEIKSLRWSNVALEDSMLTVGRAKTRKGTGRQIPINADMVTVLQEHARWYRRKMGEIKPEWYLFAGRQERL